MPQFFRASALRTSACAGLLGGSLLISGCATFTATSPQDPFRAPVSPVRLDRELMAPFTWQTAARTAAGEPLQTTTIGRDGFRSLVIGSVGGDDPVALQLTEDLARYLHDNQLIVGGVSTTILRTLNPDGLKLGRHQNAAGLYLNDQFPETRQSLSLAQRRQLPREVQFVTDHVSEQRPQRVVHIRTIQDSRGMLAVSRGAEDSGHEVAAWLGFELRHLPQDVSSGTVEFWTARRGDCDVITFGIPHETRPQDVWTLYGDAVLSLLLDGSTDSRRVAREQDQQRSAVRRSEWNDAGDPPEHDMFQEDVSRPFDSAAAPVESKLE